MTTSERAALRAEALASLPSQWLVHCQECSRCRMLVEEGETGTLHPTDVVLPLATHLVRVPGAVGSAFEAYVLRFPALVDALWSQFPAWPRSILPGAALPLAPVSSVPSGPRFRSWWLPSTLPVVERSRPFVEARALRFPELPEARWSRFPAWPHSASSGGVPLVSPPPAWPGYRWFDVALYLRWPPSLMPDRFALVEAPSAFAAVETLMRYYWLWAVPHASACLLGGPTLRYRAHRLHVVLFSPDDPVEEGAP